MKLVLPGRAVELAVTATALELLVALAAAHVAVLARASAAVRSASNFVLTAR